MSTIASDEAAAPRPIDVMVAIVNYRTPALTIDCLAALAAERDNGAPLAVVVADNASGDQSVSRIQEAIDRNGWSGWARVVACPTNGGFGYGNNVVIDRALAMTPRPRYVWLVNSDTVVRRGACGALVAYLDAHPQAGVAGSRLEDADGTPQRSAFRFHSVAGEFEAAARTGPVTRLLSRYVVAPAVPAQATRCDWVSGASLMIRTSLLEAIGTFDEGYFLYFEETDLCRRAAKAGAECHYVPASRVVHLVAASTGIERAGAPPPRRPAYWFQSRHRYFRKHHGRVQTWAADAALIAGTWIWRLRCAVARRPSDVPPRFVGDLVHHRSCDWRS